MVYITNTYEADEFLALGYIIRLTYLSHTELRKTLVVFNGFNIRVIFVIFYKLCSCNLFI
jgi:hypothetical protein